MGEAAKIVPDASPARRTVLPSGVISVDVAIGSAPVDVSPTWEVTIRCNATGTEEIFYSWPRPEDPTKTVPLLRDRPELNRAVRDDGSLYFRSLGGRQIVDYTCMVRNAAGSDSATIRLNRIRMCSYFSSRNRINN